MNLKNLTGGPALNTLTERQGASRLEGVPDAKSAAAPAPAVPSVSVKVSDVAAGALATAVSGSEFSDLDLLTSLRQRIQSGDFEIDYSAVASSLVEDALQSIGQQHPFSR